MTIKNIIFDVGNVFVYWDPYLLFKKFFNTREEIDAFFEEVDFKNFIAVSDRGIPLETVVAELAAKFPHHKKPIEAYNTDWEVTIPGSVEGTLEMMLELKKAGYGVYGLSNFTKEKFPICAEKHGFGKHFDGLVVSGDVGEIKPEEPIYKILLSNYNLKPEECVFLDDRQENLDTAKRLGFHTILFTTAAKAEQELRAMGVKF